MATGRTSRGIPVLLETLALVDELGEERLSVLPRFARAFFLVNSDPRGAIAEFARVIELAHKYGDKDTEATALAIESVVAARLGEFQRAQQASDMALKLVNEMNSPMTETDVDLFTGWSYLDMGDAGQGLEYGQRGVEKALATDRIECICSAFACVGYGFLQRGKISEAIPAFEESIRRSVASGATATEHLGRTGLAMAEFFGGRTEAVQDMEETLEKARATGDPYIAAFLSQSLGQSYTALGELDRAEGYLNDALEYYRRNAMRPYIVRDLQALADLYDRQGRSVEAANARAEADQLAEALQIPA